MKTKYFIHAVGLLEQINEKSRSFLNKLNNIGDWQTMPSIGLLKDEYSQYDKISASNLTKRIDVLTEIQIYVSGLLRDIKNGPYPNLKKDSDYLKLVELNGFYEELVI
jgi:hypothetical protein